jgi:hypothetical protein
MQQSSTQTYGQRLCILNQSFPWVKGYRLEPAPGHIDLLERFLALCEQSVGILMPQFEEFEIRHFNDEMEIIAIPTIDIPHDKTALQHAIDLTINESKIVCPECGSYSSTESDINLWKNYRCCPEHNDHLLREIIPDIMGMTTEERDELFIEALLQDLQPLSFKAMMDKIRKGL